jgi:hypothetical protein
MTVERQVIGIECAVALHERGDALVGRAGERAGHIPVHPVMDDEKVHARGHRLAEGDHAGIHGGADPGHPPVIGDLQAVEGAGRILERRPARALVAIGHEVGESRHEKKEAVIVGSSWSGFGN